MNKHDLIVEDIPLKNVEKDRNQPRKHQNKDKDLPRLLRSIKEVGIQQPIAVSERGKNQYVVIDGHRRYLCAKELEMKSVPCRIYPKLGKGEFEFLRFEMQNNRKPWSPLERAESINKVKEGFRLNSVRKVSALIHLSESMVHTSLKLRNLNIEYLEMMKDYKLSNAFQNEYVRLDSKLRKIRDIEADEIIQILFKKVEDHVISNAKDFRRLGRVFMRATANEKQLYDFLKTPDMTVEELVRMTDLSRLLALAEELRDLVTKKLKSNVSLSEKEKRFLSELTCLMEKAIKVS